MGARGGRKEKEIPLRCSIRTDSFWEEKDGKKEKGLNRKNSQPGKMPKTEHLLLAEPLNFFIGSGFDETG